MAIRAPDGANNSILRIISNLEVSFSRSTCLMSIYTKTTSIGCSKNIFKLKTDIENYILGFTET